MNRMWYRGDPHGVHIRPCEADDEHAFEARADFVLQRGDDPIPAGFKVTLCDGARVLGVAGLEPLDGGHLGAWAYLADLTPRQWLRAAGLVPEVLRHFRVGGYRIQAVPFETAPACRLLERIGFRFAYRRAGVSVFVWKDA